MENKQLETELVVFEKFVPMTTGEKAVVEKWVAEGHSPFTNPFGLVSMNGGSMLNIVHAIKENPYVDDDSQRSGKRYGGSEIVRVKELAVPGWESHCEGLLRARI